MNENDLKWLLTFLLWSSLFSVPLIRWSVRRWTEATWPAGRLFGVYLGTAGVSMILAAGIARAMGSRAMALPVLVASLCALMGRHTSGLAAETDGVRSRRRWAVGAASTFCALAIAAGVPAVALVWWTWGFITGCC